MKYIYAVTDTIRGFADYVLGRSKLLSWRRVTAWSTGTALLMGGHLDGDQWLYLTLAFIGGEAVERVSQNLSLRLGG